jgi:hypothetical protein
MHNKENNFCRICGLDQGEPPWGDDGKTPSFIICDCCGVEFGYEDTLLSSIRLYRKRWLSEGANWSDIKYKPSNWNLNDQLKQIPELYL